jgi:hypothetical protein
MTPFSPLQALCVFQLPRQLGISPDQVLVVGGALFAILFVLMLLSAVLRRGAGGGILISGPTLVLREYRRAESPSDGLFLRIVGRRKGFLAWLMTLLRMDLETQLEVRGDSFSLRSSSLFGVVQHFAPLLSVASSHCGYVRPLGWLFLAVAVVLSGGMGSWAAEDATFFVVSVIIGLVFALIYWLSRKLALWVITEGAVALGMVFKPSVIELVSVDFEEAKNAIALLNRKIVELQSPSGTALPRRTAASPPLPAAPSAAVAPSILPTAPPRTHCVKCGARLAPDDRFCGECGAPR